MSDPDVGASVVPDLREEVDPTKRETIAGWSARVLSIVCIASGVFHFYAAARGPC